MHYWFGLIHSKVTYLKLKVSCCRQYLYESLRGEAIIIIILSLTSVSLACPTPLPCTFPIPKSTLSLFLPLFKWKTFIYFISLEPLNNLQRGKVGIILHPVLVKGLGLRDVRWCSQFSRCWVSWAAMAPCVTLRHASPFLSLSSSLLDRYSSFMLFSSEGHTTPVVIFLSE